MKLSNEKNRSEVSKVDIETINKAKFYQNNKFLNESYFNQLEANNHYILGYN